MAKGQTKAFNQAQINKDNMALANAPGYQNTATSASGTLLPAYQNVIQNPGYSTADKAAITQNTLGGLGASFGDANDVASNRLARTHNSAGFGETLDELAREQGRQTSTAEAGLQEKFADTALSERDKALSGLSSLYGVSADTMAKLLQSKQLQPSSNILGSLLGAGATVGAAALGGRGK